MERRSVTSCRGAPHPTEPDEITDGRDLAVQVGQIQLVLLVAVQGERESLRVVIPQHTRQAVGVALNLDTTIVVNDHEDFDKLLRLRLTSSSDIP